MSGYEDPTPPSKYDILPGYSSSKEAINRIGENDDVAEPIEKLIDMLLEGTLSATMLDANGRKYPVDSNFWKKLGRENAHVVLWQQDMSKVDRLKMRNGWLLRSSVPRDSRPVFRTKDLDEKIPRKLQIESASAPAAREMDTISDGSQEGALIPVKNEAKIREAIMQVYEYANEQNTAIPNSREMHKFVNIILARKLSRANSTLVEKFAGEVRVKQDVPGGEYQRLICRPGDRLAKKGLKPSSELEV